MELVPGYLVGLSVIVMCTAFIKLATVLGILRQALGLKDIASAIGILGLALSLAFFQAEGLNAGTKSEVAPTLREEVKRFEPFLKKNTESDVLERLAKLRKVESPSESESPELLVASFLISELKKAFELGLMLLIPFLVIDLLVVNVIMLLGIESISATAVSLPLKLLLFISLNGWQLISEKLLSSYL